MARPTVNELNALKDKALEILVEELDHQLNLKVAEMEENPEMAASCAQLVAAEYTTYEIAEIVRDRLEEEYEYGFIVKITQQNEQDCSLKEFLITLAW